MDKTISNIHGILAFSAQIFENYPIHLTINNKVHLLAMVLVRLLKKMFGTRTSLLATSELLQSSFQSWNISIYPIIPKIPPPHWPTCSKQDGVKNIVKHGFVQSLKIMVKYKVHRVRFVPFVPQAIHCLAVEGKIRPRIAVSRYVVFLSAKNVNNKLDSSVASSLQLR